MKKNPILIGQAEVIDTLSPAVRHMLDNEGVYIGSQQGLLAECVLVSMRGKVFSMAISTELSDDGWIPGTLLEGPYRAGMGDALAACRRVLGHLLEWEQTRDPVALATILAATHVAMDQLGYAISPTAVTI